MIGSGQLERIFCALALICAEPFRLSGKGRNQTPGAWPGLEQSKSPIVLTGGLFAIAYYYKYRFSIVI